jgi:cobalt-zinc-cadmium efflux system outer membrane protein
MRGGKEREARAERDQAGWELQRRQLRLELLLAWQAVQRGEQRIALLAELLAENQRLIDSLPALVSGGYGDGGRPADGAPGAADAERSRR